MTVFIHRTKVQISRHHQHFSAESGHDFVYIWGLGKLNFS